MNDIIIVLIIIGIIVLLFLTIVEIVLWGIILE